MRFGLTEPLHELDAAHSRHHQIGEQQVEWAVLRGELERLLAIDRATRAVASVSQHEVEKLALRKLILGDQNVPLQGRRLTEPLGRARLLDDARRRVISHLTLLASTRTDASEACFGSRQGLRRGVQPTSGIDTFVGGRDRAEQDSCPCPASAN